jgi:hypothetical protein
MQVEQLDGLDPQALERLLRDTADVLRGAVQFAVDVLAVDDAVAELGGDIDLVAIGVQPFTGQFLVDERPIDLGGVEQRHATLGRLMQQLDHGLAVRVMAAVVVHSHDAETQGGHLHAEVARPQGAALGDVGQIHCTARRRSCCRLLCAGRPHHERRGVHGRADRCARLQQVASAGGNLLIHWVSSLDARRTRRTARASWRASCPVQNVAASIT